MKQLLLTKSQVLSLLAELVRAYSGVSHYIAHYRYPQGTATLSSDDSSVIVSTAEVSALTYILDHLLVPASTEETTDKYTLFSGFNLLIVLVK